MGLGDPQHMHDLSDEVLCERWTENPYYQLFSCGEEFASLAFDRSSMTRWRQRMGEESGRAHPPNVATRTGASRPTSRR